MLQFRVTALPALKNGESFQDYDRKIGDFEGQVRDRASIDPPQIRQLIV